MSMTARMAEGRAQPDLGRYFLHAHRIEFQQPTKGEAIVVVSPLATELEAWLETL
jgi:23S rRNA-/tRNA-specific pseudouridylate synthase